MGKPKITNQEWTKDELDTLKRLWESGVPIEKISKVLVSRTSDAIYNKTTRLQLERPKPEIDKKLLEKYSKLHEC